MSHDEGTFDMEVFVWYLTAYLCGVPSISQNYKKVYWRSKLLIDPDVALERPSRRIAFVDITFHLEKSCEMHFGSLWIDKDSSSSSSVAKYYTRNTISLSDLETHFTTFRIDLRETPSSVLARNMALALQTLGSTAEPLKTTGIHQHHNHEIDIHDDACTKIVGDNEILLFYVEFRQYAPLLLIEPKQTHISLVDQSLLNMLLLQNHNANKVDIFDVDETIKKLFHSRFQNQQMESVGPVFQPHLDPNDKLIPEKSTTTTTASTITQSSLATKPISLSSTILLQPQNEEHKVKSKTNKRPIAYKSSHTRHHRVGGRKKKGGFAALLGTQESRGIGNSDDGNDNRNR